MTEPEFPYSPTVHWDRAYAGGGADVSWHQPRAATSLALIEAVAPAPRTAVIDIGGGASTLVDGLLAAGFTDITVLDLAADGLAIARRRLGDAASGVHWIAADLLAWNPPRRYGVWHDRAVLHFLVDDWQRARYRATLDRALEPGGHAVIGVFAEDGPERCSNLPVRRYAHNELADFLGEGFETIERRRELHETPSGKAQPFNWVVARRV